MLLSTKAVQYWQTASGVATGENYFSETPILGGYHPAQGDSVTVRESRIHKGMMRMIPSGWSNAEIMDLVASLLFEEHIISSGANSKCLVAEGIMGEPDHVVKNYQLLRAEVHVLEENGGKPIHFREQLYWAKYAGPGRLVAPPIFMSDWRWDP